MAAHEKWMPLYIGDYLADTMHLTTAQHGAYLLLLMHAWRNGGHIPTTPEGQASIARMPVKDWSKDAEMVLEFFDFDPTGEKKGIWHSRVVDELSVAKAVTKQRSKAGKASAAKRERERQQKPNENPTPVEHPLDSRATPSPSPSVSNDTDADAASVIFKQGLGWLMKSTGKAEGNCRAQLGKWRKEIGDEALIAVLGRGQREAPIDAMAWLEKAVAANGKGPTRKPWEKADTTQALPPSEPWEQRVRGYKPGGFWKPNDWGPPPESPSTRVPAPILAAWRRSGDVSSLAPKTLA